MNGGVSRLISPRGQADSFSGAKSQRTSLREGQGHRNVGGLVGQGYRGTSLKLFQTVTQPDWTKHVRNDHWSRE